MHILTTKILLEDKEGELEKIEISFDADRYGVTPSVIKRKGKLYMFTIHDTYYREVYVFDAGGRKR